MRDLGFAVVVSFTFASSLAFANSPPPGPVVPCESLSEGDTCNKMQGCACALKANEFCGEGVEECLVCIDENGADCNHPYYNDKGGCSAAQAAVFGWLAVLAGIVARVRSRQAGAVLRK